MLFLSSLLAKIQLLLKILGLCDFPLSCGRPSLPPQISGQPGRVLKTWYPVLSLLSSLWHSERHCITPSFLHCHTQALLATHRYVLPRQKSSSLQFLMHLLTLQTKNCIFYPMPCGYHSLICCDFRLFTQLVAQDSNLINLNGCWHAKHCTLRFIEDASKAYPCKAF